MSFSSFSVFLLFIDLSTNRSNTNLHPGIPPHENMGWAYIYLQKSLLVFCLSIVILLGVGLFFLGFFCVFFTKLKLYFSISEYLNTWKITSSALSILFIYFIY